MSLQEPDLIYMKELLAQLKLAQQSKDEAQRDLDLWIQRMELAKQARDRALWEAAREKALEAEQKVRKVESVLMELEVERDHFKRKASAPRLDPSTAQAHHLLEQFKGLGVNPDDAPMRELEREAGAASMLDALKKKMDG